MSWLSCAARLLAIAGAGAVALLASCGAPAAKTSLESVTIAYSSEGTIAQITPYIAEQKGYFREHGLQVTRLLVRGNNESAAAMASGQVQAANSSLEGIFSAALQGGIQPLVLATPAPRYAYSIVGTKEIQSVKDLVGKPVALGTTPGTEVEYALNAEFATLGLPPRSFTPLYIGANPLRVAALESGRAAATLLDPPYDMAMEGKGYKILARVYQDVKTPVAATTFYTLRPYAESHRAEMVAMLKGAIKAIKFAKANPAEAKQLIASWTKLEDQAGIDAAYQAYFVDMYTTEPIPALEAIQTALDNAARTRGQEPSMKADQVTDASYVQQAIEELKKEG